MSEQEEQQETWHWVPAGYQRCDCGNPDLHRQPTLEALIAQKDTQIAALQEERDLAIRREKAMTLGSLREKEQLERTVEVHIQRAMKAEARIAEAEADAERLAAEFSEFRADCVNTLGASIPRSPALFQHQQRLIKGPSTSTASANPAPRNDSAMPQEDSPEQKTS